LRRTSQRKAHDFIENYTQNLADNIGYLDAILRRYLGKQVSKSRSAATKYLAGGKRRW